MKKMVKKNKKKNRKLPVAVGVIVIGLIAYWLWPAEAPPPATQPAPTILKEHATEEPAKQPAHEEKDKIRVTFINHLGDANVTFSVDGVHICTATAGKACYGDVPFGKHVVEALEGDKVIRTLNLSLDQDTAEPKVVVCFPTSPDC
ncbi:MAG TPA: hypothetical protein VKC56_01335 [Gallionellaceae bacterium]|nr:hypothetical protein [Gallionellaceae bacterium]